MAMARKEKEKNALDQNTLGELPLPCLFCRIPQKDKT